MNFTELKYFQTLYRCGSFSVAADCIPMTIQGLRKAIRSLEQEFGIVLCRSGKDGLSFTEAGERLYLFCQDSVGLYDALCKDMNVLRRGGRKEISMAFSAGSFGLFASQFAERLSDSIWVEKLSHITRPETEIVRFLKDGTYDFAVTWGNPDLKQFSYTHIADIPLYAILNRQHAKAHRPYLKIQDLEGERLIFFDAFQKPHQILKELCLLHGFEPDMSYGTSETMVMLTYLSQNLGIGFVLPNEISLYDEKQFCSLRVEGVFFPVGIAYLRHHCFSAEEKDLIGLLKKLRI